MSSTAGAVITRSGQSAEISRQLRAAIWLAVVALIGFVSLLLTWRRIAGALTEPLSDVELIAAAIVLLIAAVLLRRLAPAHFARYQEFPLPGVAAFLLLAAVTLAGTPAWGIAIAWLIFFAGEAAAWLVHYKPAAVFRGGRLDHSTSSDESSSEVEEPVIPAGLVQQITRVREGDRETIHALFETCVAAGDRLGVVHLAFCPPLAARPELTAHAIDCDNAEVRITQVETFGARLEVRFEQAAVQTRRIVGEMLGSITVPPES